MALIQKATANTVSGTSATATFASTPTNGNLLILAIFTRSDSGFTDPSGWTRPISIQDAASFDTLAICYKVASSDGTAVTVTIDSGISTAMAIWEYSGNTATPLDKTDATTTLTQTGRRAGVTGTLSQADELIVAAVSARDTITGPFYDAPFALVDWVATGGNIANLMTTTLVVASTASLSPEVHWGTNAQLTMGVVATFKMAAAAASNIPVVMHHRRVSQSAAIRRPKVRRGFIQSPTGLYVPHARVA